MLKFHKTILFIAAVALPALPVAAQEAAFDQVNVNASIAAPAPQPSQMQVAPQLRPAANSNVGHWSHFSQSANSASSFRRVAPGSCLGTNGVRHYIRPQCVEPGSVPRHTAQSSDGAVHRYLACNVPAGQGAYNPNAGASSRNSIKRSAHKPTMIMSYGKHSGEVTYTAASSKWNGTPISCYGRYQ